MGLLTRYTMREIIAQFLGVFSVVLVIFLVRRFGVLLQEAAEGSVGLLITLQLLGLRTVMALPSLLPVAVYVSILLGVSRLSMEQELTAMSACGVAPGRLQRSVMTFAALASVGIGLLAFSVRPWAATHYEALRREAAAGLELGSLVPGRFYEISATEEYVVFAEGRTLGPAGHLQQVFVQQRDDDRVAILSSEQAVEYRDEREGYRFLRLVDGHRYDFREGRSTYETTEFGELVLRSPLSPMVAAEPDEDTLSSRELWRSTSLDHRAELQWRLTMPMSAFVLAIFAIPFAHVDPRRGRSASVFLALLVYIVYRNLLGMAKNWVEDGTIGLFPGLWLVHAVAIAVALVLLLRDTRRG